MTEKKSKCEHSPQAVDELREPLLKFGDVVVFSGTCECGEDLIVRLSITNVEEDAEGRVSEVVGR